MTSHRYAGNRTQHGLSTPTGDHWLAQAVCRDQDPELFFPIGTSGPALIQAEQAKAVCRRCPVVGECLQWALEVGIGYGVVGGKSPSERQAMLPPRPKDGRASNGFRRPPRGVCEDNASNTHCVRGHEYNAANTYLRTRGGRQCRICMRLADSDRRQKAGAA